LEKCAALTLQFYVSAAETALNGLVRLARQRY
jgi:hypothetical protein